MIPPSTTVPGPQTMPFCDPQERRCARCGEFYAPSFFAVTWRLGSKCYPRTICKACSQTARDRKKQARRSKTKAQRTLRTHWERYCRRAGDGISQREFAERFGWDIEQMAHDIEHAAGNGCPYCHRSFALMEGGLHNVSLDIVDPRTPPYYTTNVRWVCKTCNSAKGDMTLEQFGEHLANWAKWERRQKVLSDDPWAGTLFEGFGFTS